jgi:hypothetical protein
VVAAIEVRQAVMVVVDRARRGVDAWGDGAQQRGQRVDRPGALARHLIAGGGEHAQHGAVAGSAGSVQLLVR